MLDLFIDFAAVIVSLGLPAYVFLLLSERKLGLPYILTTGLAFFCIFGGLNQGFQAWALYQADHIAIEDIKDEDLIGMLWVVAMVLKAFALNFVAAGAFVYGAEIREKAKKFHRNTTALQDQRAEDQDHRGEDQDRRGEEQDRRESRNNGR
jgi:hypothetical protein